MGQIKIYIPVVGPKTGKGTWYTVNGAKGPDRDEAVRKASKHTGITSGQDEIKRVDEEDVWEDQWYGR